MFDPTMFHPATLLLLPAILLSAWAQMRVKSTYALYSQRMAGRGVTAESVARMLLDRFGLSGVPINRVPGDLTDHYDPRDRTLNLSDSVYGSSSIAAIGVAAHEVGHAIQHGTAYSPLMFRNAIAAPASLVSNFSMPLFLIGFISGSGTLMNLGIFLFLGVLVFQLVTLPVEFDASARALKLLRDTNSLTDTELGGAKKVLSAAAWTYIAGMLMTVMQLIRLLIIRNSRSRD